MTYPNPQPTARHNTLATVSLLSGIAGWFVGLIGLLVGFFTFGMGWLCVACLPPLFWLTAAGSGFVARGQIRRSGEGGDGQATAGLVMGGVGMVLVLGGLCLVGSFIGFTEAIDLLNR